ncbi:CarboxypepD_reg-like domain-containing protein [bacterium A37T11]|nr:CarboxypepD_reg-like domain-containing protein [bacterium A37T11]
MPLNHIYKLVSLSCILLIYSLVTNAQSTIVTGTIKDARTGETLPYVSISVPGTTFGTSADDDGKYRITVTGAHTRLRFGYVGYKTLDTVITPGAEQKIDVSLQVDQNMLDEVVVTGKKQKYRNKNNPAVELIRKVIAHKDENRLTYNDFVEYQQYEKLTMALSNLSDRFRNKRLFRNYQFLFKEQDSSAVGGKNILPAYMQEKVEQVYFRKDPYKKKEVVLAERKAEFDPRFLDNDGISAYTNKLYEQIDIYENDIPIATNLLLSPIAGTSPTFYKFYIRDTIKTQQPWLVELGFVPRNKTDLLFEGKLYITLDGHYAVQNAYLTVGKDINLNFMRDMDALLEFEKDDNGRYFLKRSSLNMEFALSKNGGGLQGNRIVSYKDYKVNQPRPDSVYSGPAVQVAYKEPEEGEKPDESYWSSIRHEPLSPSEKDIYRNVDTLQTIPSFRRTMDIATLLLAGYKSVGPFEIGPANTFYSFNPIEGFRLRLGGRTTPQLSKRWYAETYGAYGFRDKKWKYFLSGTYSLNNKSIYHFPLNYIRASYQRDTKIPGQELQFVQEDNFLLSFKRGDNRRYMYNDEFNLEYVHEFTSHFSYKAKFTHWKQSPTGILEYNLPNSLGQISQIKQLENSEASLILRYAPHEQFYQGKLYRTPLYNKYPIFSLGYYLGLNGFLGGENTYQKFIATADKRLYLSQLGYADIGLEGSYIFGKNLSFPLLSIHRANQTYAYQLNSYNLMNFLEFVSDHYAAINLQYYMNGFLFNKIPLLKKLKLREVFSFKGLVGRLRDENNPMYNNGVYQFPKDENGQDITYKLHQDPYMEASVGVANIFKILRVDVVKRLTYLDNPGISEWGIRARLKFDF